MSVARWVWYEWADALQHTATHYNTLQHTATPVSCSTHDCEVYRAEERGVSEESDEGDERGECVGEEAAGVVEGRVDRRLNGGLEKREVIDEGGERRDCVGEWVVEGRAERHLCGELRGTMLGQEWVGRGDMRGVARGVEGRGRCWRVPGDVCVDGCAEGRRACAGGRKGGAGTRVV